MQGRKRLAFTIKQKMKIIQEIECGKSKSDVARELGLASSTVATIWKNRESITESWRNRDVMQMEDTDLKKTTPIQEVQLVQKQTQNHELLEVRCRYPDCPSCPELFTKNLTNTIYTSTTVIRHVHFCNQLLLKYGLANFH